MLLATKTRLVEAAPGAAQAAAQCLGRGGLVAFPTETVYGLGADATNGQAVARLYEAKGRPAFNPLIAHVPDIAVARDCAVFNADAETLAAAFWPGPLTLVLPRKPDCKVSELATAGLDTIAVRVPDHAMAHAILRAFGKPVVAPSANVSGHVSPTTAAHVLDDLDGRIDMIVDGGPTPVGIESTVVACIDQPTLLRPGGLSRAQIAAMVGRDLSDAPAGAEDNPIAPGMLTSHYAPRTRLRLDATSVEPGEVLLAFGTPLPGAATVLNLSEQGNLAEAAANLFGHLRRLDGLRAPQIAVMRIPHQGLGEAINDRLRRAAAPK
ncbi:L-threonylcarbamoyladenylate synthase [Pseudorhodoplanes sp.]|uniref:L-threonylcarbamoyladenylate synthase n=1 Tax=Pseudorhodoplanes sp. TaxID=1934341 RepID=UPI002D08052C|nr:L-threonylcarbamoyladenylate synthase [Pseudorhodoplanes sp.]HWV40969.1 L-threonylcarbamoyladenylate synthase [Pseudorhodoplanes sp.]